MKTGWIAIRNRWTPPMMTLIFLKPPSDVKKIKKEVLKGVSLIKLYIVRRFTKATHGKASI
jgi:hypothetical protein